MLTGPRGERRTILVVYHARKSLPLRLANADHLWCWRRHSAHRVIYLNAAFPIPWRLLRRAAIGAVVLDTILLSLHWSPDYFRERAAELTALRDFDCPKIALPQDEFINIGIVVEFLAAIGVTHLLTCTREQDWPIVYAGLDFTAVALRRVLTGYVEDTRVPRYAGRSAAARPIDIGYRAWRNPYWLGEHGTHKVRIAETIAPAARARGLAIDINNPESSDFLVGEAWLRFLSRCKAVLGVEGGASICDRDGSISRRVTAYLSAHPSATFEETRAVCFPGADHRVDIACISPRHFEACLTRTCQVLLEGDYNGVLQPWRHYIPVRRDYSNLDEVFAALTDKTRVAEIVGRAWDEIVASGRWGYRRFVRETEADIVEPALSTAETAGASWFAIAALVAYERLLWLWANMEARSGIHRWYWVIPRLMRALRGR